MSSARPMERILALQCDRALSGLDPQREMELVAAMPPGTRLDPKLELAAAAIACSELTIDEPLPRALAEKLFASAVTPSPTIAYHSGGGTIPMPGRPERVSEVPRSAPAKVIPLAKPAPRTWIPWLAAAACLALAIGALLTRRGTDGQVASTTPPSATTAPKPTPAEAKAKLLAEARDIVRTAWSPTDDPAGKGESGEVVWSNERQEGYMTFRTVARNDPKAVQYQLWIFDAERDEKYPVDGGVFDVDPTTGEVVVPISAKVRVNKPTLFAVTVEKPGGVVVSKRERIVVTAKVAS